MRIEKRTNSDGTTYYSFVWYDSATKKHKRLTKAEIKKRFGHDIVDPDEAKQCLTLLEAQYETEKVKIERRLAWQEKYYNFNGLVEYYEKWQKKNAPESFANNVFYLKNYVLPFFLTKKMLNNVELWPDHFDDFREWLEKDAVLLRDAKKTISYSGKNHAVKALNTFLASMLHQKLISKELTCKPFPEHLVGSRTIDDVIHLDEFDSVQSSLEQLGHHSERLFHRLLYYTGLRYEEGRGLSLGDVFQGELKDSLLGRSLDLNGIKYYGYIVIDSQYVGTLPDGKVERKPLKGQKKISERAARTIPITDPVLWNELVDKAKDLHGDYKARKFGAEKKDYLFFKDIVASTSDKRLQAAFERAKLKYRSWHCCRHSRATWLIGEVKDTMIVRLWLGHKSLAVLERYNHMYQAIVRQARLRETLDDDFGFTKVKA